MPLKILKRDGRQVDFVQQKIVEAIFAAARSIGGNDRALSEQLAEKVKISISEKFTTTNPTVEDIQDTIERILLEEHHLNTAKAFILYREKKAKLRNLKHAILGKMVDKRISLNALKILKEKRNVQVAWGKDLRTIEEDELMKEFSSPIIVTNYPKEIMAFYKPRDPKNPKTALCFDMLAPEGYGEIIGGSERESDIEKIKKRLKEMGEKVENYSFYLDTRRYGSVPHGGFGMGVERVVSWICGLENIKDAIPFPRTPGRFSP